MSKTKYVAAKDRVKLSVGNVIKEACELNNITQAELSKISGINPPNLSDIINGKRKIGKAVAEKLAKALNVSPAFILFAGGVPRKGSESVQHTNPVLLWKAIQKVDDDNVRTILQYFAQTLFSTSQVQKAPLDLVAQSAKHSHLSHIKKNR